MVAWLHTLDYCVILKYVAFFYVHFCIFSQKMVGAERACNVGIIYRLFCGIGIFLLVKLGFDIFICVINRHGRIVRRKVAEAALDSGIFIFLRAIRRDVALSIHES